MAQRWFANAGGDARARRSASSERIERRGGGFTAADRQAAMHFAKIAIVHVQMTT